MKTNIRSYLSIKLLCLVWVSMIFNHIILAQSKPVSKDDYLLELDEKIPAWLEEFIVPGAAIALIDNGEVIFQKGYGYADVKNQVKINSQTGFNIGSISKTVTAWGVMKLVEDGKIELDSPAEKYLTRWHFPNSDYDVDEVTIRRLLSHTAGLSLHGYPGLTLKVFLLNKRGFRVELHSLIFALPSFIWLKVRNLSGWRTTNLDSRYSDRSKFRNDL